MQIKQMFKKDIHREIQGVIKVAQKSDDIVYQELDEYVVTRELRKHFSLFYENYLKSLSGYTNEMGVWISGFFGSGKSHFLKILSYILENKSVNNKMPVEFFKEKIDDNIVFADIQKAGSINCETILFNIDSKSPMGIKNDKDAILKVFIKVFYEHLGYYGENFRVAELEKHLDKEARFEGFKAEFEKITGKQWINRRNCFAFDEDNIVTSLINSTGMSEVSARNWFKQSKEIDISIEKFAKEVKTYLDNKGENSHLVFLVDEIGQYIGENTSLMLNLQTLTEDLGTHCKGKVWVIVTSQEDIDTITPKVKGNDFSKIQGRFKTRLSLSSASVDEVIKKRILEKSRDARDKLKLIYTENQAGLRNLIHFSEGSMLDLKGYGSKEEFADTYPFIPYQFRLLQNVFEQVRRHGASGKHLSEGERSMLSAFQDAAKFVAENNEMTLVPFYIFYDSIYTFLDGSIRRVIDRATTSSKNNDGIDSYDVKLLKLLFLIRYIGDIRSNIDNIATLMIDTINQDKLLLKEDIRKSLTRLCAQNYIQKNAEEYKFLTDDEQDINREIKNTIVEPENVSQEIGKYIFNELYDSPKYQYSKRYPITFNKKIDESTVGNQSSSIGLRILTRFSDLYDTSEEALRMASSKASDVIIRLSDKSEYFDEIQEALRINRFIKQKDLSTAPSGIKSIIENKRDEEKERIKRAKKEIEEAIIEGKFYIYGDSVDIKGTSAKEKINNAFKSMVERVYIQISYISEFIDSDSDIISLLKKSYTQINMDGTDVDSNKLAVSEVVKFIDLRDSQHMQITMKAILEKFESVPYGWNEIDIAGIIARLFKEQQIKLMYQGIYIEVDDRNIPSYLRKRNEVEKLIIKKRVSVDPMLLRSAKNICKDIFGKSDVRDDEDGIVTDVLECIKIKTDELKGNFIKYYEREQKYPGRAVVEKGIGIFNEINQLKKDSLLLLKKLNEHKDDLLDWDEDMKDIIGFFNNQKDIFDRGIEVIKLANENAAYLDENMRQKVNELEKIINNHAPYNQIKNISDIAQGIDKGYKNLLDDKKEKVKNEILKDKSALDKVLDGCELDENEKTGFSQKNKTWYEEKVNTINLSKGFERLDAIITQSKHFMDNAIKEIDDLAKKKRREAACVVVNEGNKTVLTKVKAVCFVKYKELATVDTIETEGELDQYLEKLNEKLRAVLRDDKKIVFRG